MAMLIDNGAVEGDMGYVLRIGLIMLGITALGAVFALTRNVAASVASQSFGMDLRNDTYTKIQHLSVEEMDKFEGGSLVTRMTNDISQIQNFINGMMRIFFKAPIICLGAIIMAATLNYRVIPIIVPVICMVAVVIYLSMKMTYPRFAKVQKSLDGMNTTMREYLVGIRLVKAFRRFKEEERRFGAANDTLTENSIKAGRVLAILSPCMTIFMQFGVVTIILLGSRWVNMSEMGVGEVMAFIAYMGRIVGSLGMISNVLNQFVRVKTSHERVSEILRMETGVDISNVRTPYMVSIQKSAQNPTGATGISYTNVTFEYKGSTGEAALKNVSFSVEKGHTVGIIGSTGSGKSTLASLLMRFYDVTNGDIYISGENIMALDEATLRSRIAIVPQVATLFTGTIMENILWGKGDADETEVDRAAKTAEAYEFISTMPDKYDTWIGQGGVNLSGGQKQRLSIARAIIRQPEILILDDCTSALDVMTEAKVRKGLREYSDGMTCLLISQRVSTAMTCDRILVLENGEQAGYGTHDELMEACSVYRDIYMSQIGEDDGQ
jgi:ATP-binding cassette subfamily B protein